MRKSIVFLVSLIVLSVLATTGFAAQIYSDLELEENQPISESNSHSVLYQHNNKTDIINVSEVTNDTFIHVKNTTTDPDNTLKIIPLDDESSVDGLLSSEVTALKPIENEYTYLEQEVQEYDTDYEAYAVSHPIEAAKRLMKTDKEQQADNEEKAPPKDPILSTISFIISTQ